MYNIILHKKAIKFIESRNLKDKQKINIQVDNKRKIIFQDVIVRIKEGNLALHLDTDEGNAAGIAKNAFGKILYRKK